MPLVSAPRISKRFSTTAGASAADELTMEVEHDATIERVDVRFYRGPQLDLELRPFVEPREGDRIDIVDLIGRSSIVGDNDVFRFSVSEQVRRGDTIGVEYENTDGANGYDFVVDMMLDRAGGVDRLVGLLGGL